MALLVVLSVLIGLVYGGSASAVDPLPTSKNTAAFTSSGVSGASSLAATLGSRTLTAAFTDDWFGLGLTSVQLYSAEAATGRTLRVGGSASGIVTDSVTSGCLDNTAWFTSDEAWYITGRTVDCSGGDHKITLTFDTPVINPVLRPDTGAVATDLATLPAGTAGACYATWNDLTITAINGADPAAYETTYSTETATPIGEHQVTTEYSNYRLTHTPYTGSGCYHYPLSSDTRPLIEVTGVVTSITLQISQMAMITHQGEKSCVLFICSDGNFKRDWIVALPDYTLGVNLPVVDLAVSKVGPATVTVGGEVEWSVAVTNHGEFDSHGFVVEDVVPAEVTGATLVSAPEGCVLVDRDLRCERPPQGWALDSSRASYPVVTGGDVTSAVAAVLAAGETTEPIVLRGTATGAEGDTITNTATVSGVDHDPDGSNDTAIAVTAVAQPTWSVAKTTDVTGYVSPGDVITYTVTATSTGATDVSQVVLTDDLTDVLAHADLVSGSVRLVLSDRTITYTDGQVPTAAAPVLRTDPFTLPAGQSVSLTYQVTVRDDAWSTVLENTVVAEGSTSPGTCVAGAVADAVCSTSTAVTARLDLIKRGTVNGQVAALDGAAFEVLTDADGSIGAATGLVVAALTDVGSFEIAGIEPGTYWLRETRAPDGHELLAQAVRFAVDGAGAVSLTDPAASTQVTVEDGRIVVTDSPRFDVPATGGSGTGPVLGLGLLLVLVGAAALGIRTRRRRHGDRAKGGRISA